MGNFKVSSKKYTLRSMWFSQMSPDPTGVDLIHFQGQTGPLKDSGSRFYKSHRDIAVKASHHFKKFH
jgi:hypothetical protein